MKSSQPVLSVKISDGPGYTIKKENIFTTHLNELYLQEVCHLTLMSLYDWQGKKFQKTVRWKDRLCSNMDSVAREIELVDQNNEAYFSYCCSRETSRVFRMGL